MEKKMNRVRDYVERILRKEEKARNDNRLLTYRFYQEYYRTIENKNFDNMSAKDFLLDYHAPEIESVRRARQKCQESQPELRANKIIQQIKDEKQEAMREWVRGN